MKEKQRAKALDDPCEPDHRHGTQENQRCLCCDMNAKEKCVDPCGNPLPCPYHAAPASDVQRDNRGKARAYDVLHDALLDITHGIYSGSAEARAEDALAAAEAIREEEGRRR